jgi:hypothetical protein
MDPQNLKVACQVYHCRTLVEKEMKRAKKEKKKTKTNQIKKLMQNSVK